MLEIRGLSKSYVGKEALRNVDLTLEQGEIVGLIGENGAGKSTLLKCILSFLPHRGEVLLDGKKIDRSNISRLSFATCEHSYFPNLTPKLHREFYELHFGSFRAERFETLMDFFELPGNIKLRSFSTGQKNQFEVIMALCQGADYILMDEPFAGNDVFNREDFYKVLLSILEPSETVFLSTHLIALAVYTGAGLAWYGICEAWYDVGEQSGDFSDEQEISTFRISPPGSVIVNRGYRPRGIPVEEILGINWE